MREICGLVMVQKDEGELLRINVSYHLAIGFSRVVVVDNCSEDPLTVRILQTLSRHPQVTVIFDKSVVCDQERLANEGLAALLDDPAVQWVFPFDADEFLYCSDGLETFLSTCRQSDTQYGSLPWLNHICDYASPAADPMRYLSGTLFYSPWPERDWQEPGHFRKSFCLRHPDMKIVVGGHFFRREANMPFFDRLGACPRFLPDSLGALFHFEMRDYASALLRKWRDLSRRHQVNGVGDARPWSEKERWMASLWSRYNERQSDLFDDFARKRRTLWGNPIPIERFKRRSELSSVLSSLHL
jgi:Glycosyl transferase family 2